MLEKSDGKFLFEVKFRSRLQSTVELSHESVLKNFKGQEPKFYSILFDVSEKGPFQVPPGSTNKERENAVHDDPKLYILQ